MTLYKFLKKIRNGVAHQNISPNNQGKKWKGLRLWNHNEYGIKDFEVEFYIGELKVFAIFIAQKYLDELTKISNLKESQENQDDCISANKLKEVENSFNELKK